MPIQKPGLPILTPRLILRTPEPALAQAYTRYAVENREHLAPWEPLRDKEHYTEEYWRAETARQQQEIIEDKAFRLVFLLRDQPNGSIVGTCNFNNIFRGPFQACFLGYSCDYRYEGKGYMREGLEAAINYVFEHLHLHRIQANYMPRNERSGKLLKKLGFIPEGYARDYLKIAGVWEDHVLTSLTNQQYDDSKQ